jgi:hypothetical protein
VPRLTHRGGICWRTHPLCRQMPTQPVRLGALVIAVTETLDCLSWQQSSLPAVTNPSRTPPAIVAATTQGGCPLQAVINPSQTSPATVVAATQGRRISGAVSVAIGGPLAAGSATGVGSVATLGGSAPADRAQASIEEQRVCGHFVPCLCMQAELCAEDPRLQRLTNANSWL